MSPYIHAYIHKIHTYLRTEKTLPIVNRRENLRALKTRRGKYIAAREKQINPITTEAKNPIILCFRPCGKKDKMEIRLACRKQEYPYQYKSSKYSSNSIPAQLELMNRDARVGNSGGPPRLSGIDL